MMYTACLFLGSLQKRPEPVFEPRSNLASAFPVQERRRYALSTSWQMLPPPWGRFHELHLRREHLPQESRVRHRLSALRPSGCTRRWGLVRNGLIIVLFRRSLTREVCSRQTIPPTIAAAAIRSRPRLDARAGPRPAVALRLRESESFVIFLLGFSSGFLAKGPDNSASVWSCHEYLMLEWLHDAKRGAACLCQLSSADHRGPWGVVSHIHNFAGSTVAKLAVHAA